MKALLFSGFLFACFATSCMSEKTALYSGRETISVYVPLTSSNPPETNKSENMEKYGVRDVNKLFLTRAPDMEQPKSHAKSQLMDFSGSNAIASIIVFLATFSD